MRRLQSVCVLQALLANRKRRNHLAATTAAHTFLEPCPSKLFLLLLLILLADWRPLHPAAG